MTRRGNMASKDGGSYPNFCWRIRRRKAGRLLPHELPSAGHGHPGSLPVLHLRLRSEIHEGPSSVQPGPSDNRLQRPANRHQLLHLPPRRDSLAQIGHQVPARRLLPLGVRPLAGEHDVPVLHHQTGRPPGHRLLRAEEEVQPGELPARVPPRGDDRSGVHRHQVHPGGPRLLPGDTEQLRPRGHVHLLLRGRAGARVQEVPLVEEVHHADSDRE